MLYKHIYIVMYIYFVVMWNVDPTRLAQLFHWKIPVICHFLIAQASIYWAECQKLI